MNNKDIIKSVLEVKDNFDTFCFMLMGCFGGEWVVDGCFFNKYSKDIIM